MSAIRAFLGELIDDAGLFPPARLAMADALAAHERAEAGETYWVLGRFVVPAARIGELIGALDDTPDPLPLAVTCEGTAAAAEFAAAARHEDERGERITIEAVECKLGAAARLDALLDAFERAGFASAPSLYLELDPADGDLEETFAALRDARAERGFDLCAKLRCGGVEPAAVPSPALVARFIATARAAGVPFKATAALHHPLRREASASGPAQHGFLNLIGAAVFSSAFDLPANDLEALVADPLASDFALDARRFAWREREVDAEAIGSARARLVRSYGSCSFEEPLAGLRELGMLAPA